MNWDEYFINPVFNASTTASWTNSTTPVFTISNGTSLYWIPQEQKFIMKIIPDIEIEEDELLDVLREGDNNRNSC